MGIVNLAHRYEEIGRKIDRILVDRSKREQIKIVHIDTKVTWVRSAPNLLGELTPSWTACEARPLDVQMLEKEPVSM